VAGVLVVGDDHVTRAGEACMMIQNEASFQLMSLGIGNAK
jgi:hypothetical protein